MRLSYDALVRQYLETLNAKLRNFAVEPEFVATWVHDEDDQRSLQGLFVAAQAGGCRELTVEVSAETAAKLDRAGLSKELTALGEVSLQPRKDGGLDVGVRLKDKLEFDPRSGAGSGPAAKSATVKTAGPQARRRPSRPGELDELYLEAVWQRALRFEGAVAGDGKRVRVEEGGVALEASVDETGVVKSARHFGAASPLSAVLDVLCEVMEGRPLQEASDHAVIRVEARLRDQSVPRPVAGLLTPANADPIFALPQRLVRGLYRKYLEATGAKSAANFWDDSAAASWTALSAEDKLKRARAAVAEACQALGLPAQGVEVLEILGGVRLVLAHTPVTSKPVFAAPMMKLEGLVKKSVDARIELQMESLEDRNRRAERTARGDKAL